MHRTSNIQLAKTEITHRRIARAKKKCSGCEAALDTKLAASKPNPIRADLRFCQSCQADFYGTWDCENPALRKIIRWMATKPPPQIKLIWGGGYKPFYHQGLTEIEYERAVRKLSLANYRRFNHSINPQDRLIGPSGVKGACHVDHIVPVRLCWFYKVTVRQAAHWRNLQVIPWRVNLHRGLVLEGLIGWPGWQDAARQINCQLIRDPSRESPGIRYVRRKITLRNFGEWKRSHQRTKFSAV